MTLVQTRELWGHGLAAVDVHLPGSVLIKQGGRLWTRDNRLRRAAIEVDAGVIDS